MRWRSRCPWRQPPMRLSRRPGQPARGTPTSLLCTKQRWRTKRRRRRRAAAPPDAARSRWCTSASGATPAPAAGGTLDTAGTSGSRSCRVRLSLALHPARSAMPIERNRRDHRFMRADLQVPGRGPGPSACPRKKIALRSRCPPQICTVLSMFSSSPFITVAGSETRRGRLAVLAPGGYKGGARRVV